MIVPIQITENSIPLMERFDLGKATDPNVNIFTEAVFVNGKQKVQPIVDAFQKIKDALDEELLKPDATEKFDPEVFVRNTVWKDLELKMCKVFGFKHVSISNILEGYLGNGDIGSQALDAFTYPTWRYPIDGLITNDGFYDKTHSIELMVVFYLGVLKRCTAEEITAIFLHELGHNIDPALVDIRFVATNNIVDYIIGSNSDTESRRNNDKTYDNDDSLGFMDIIEAIVILLSIITVIPMIIVEICKFIKRIFTNIFTSEESLIDSVRKVVRENSREFSHLKNTEAFADNFARMYGFGVELMSGLKKLGDYNDKMFDIEHENSLIAMERERQIGIANITKAMLNDVHNVDITRAVALLKEYDKELADPKIPAKVKKNIKEDRDRLQKIIDMYLNHSDEFRRRLNQAIYNELMKRGAIQKNDQ